MGRPTKDIDELRHGRMTINATCETKEAVRLAAKRIGISVSDFLNILVESELERIENMSHITEIRRRA